MVVPNIKYPKASANLFLGSIALAIVTIAFAEAPNPSPWINLTIKRRVTLFAEKYSMHAKKWMLKKTMANLFQFILSSAFAE